MTEDKNGIERASNLTALIAACLLLADRLSNVPFPDSVNSLYLLPAGLLLFDYVEHRNREGSNTEYVKKKMKTVFAGLTIVFAPEILSAIQSLSASSGSEQMTPETLDAIRDVVPQVEEVGKSAFEVFKESPAFDHVLNLVQASVIGGALYVGTKQAARTVSNAAVSAGREFINGLRNVKENYNVTFELQSPLRVQVSEVPNRNRDFFDLNPEEIYDEW